MQVYKPYLLINKKRYAGLLYTSPDKPDKMDAKARASRLAMAHMRALPSPCMRAVWGAGD